MSGLNLNEMTHEIYDYGHIYALTPALTGQLTYEEESACKVEKLA